MQKNLIIISILSSILLFTGCEAHRIDIQQGNRVNPATFEKLKTGMTRKQVIFLLGSPLLSDPFHQNRWDYIYHLKPGNQPAKQSRVTLYFKDAVLEKIDSSKFTPAVYEHTKSVGDHVQGTSAKASSGGHSH